MVVEDDPDVCPLLEHILAVAGYAVDTAATVAKAMRLLEGGAYDLVLADGELPDGHGIRVADESMRRGVRALILTGCALRMSKDEVERHSFVMKPIRPSELLEIVKRRLAAPQGSEKTGRR